MADSLDDFFAKKDKKRGKDKGKAAFSAEALVRELEEGAKQADSYPVRKDNKTSAAIEMLGLDANDADWRDFEDVEKRDYTGLKIKEMSLQDQNEEEQRRLTAEQAEPVQDGTAWKIKEDIASPATIASETTLASKLKGDIESDTNKTVSSSQDKKDEPTKQQSNKQPGATPDDDSSSNSGEGKNVATEPAAAKKEGDTKPSAKYVPPSERNLIEGKVLEPVKMKSLKSTSSRQPSTLDFQDEKAFPSLG